MNDSSRHTWTSPAALTALALATLALTVYGSLIPFHYQPRPLADALAAFEHITLHNPTDLDARGDWIISFVLYLVLSFLLMAGVCVDRPRRKLLAAPVVFLFCTALSVAIEFVQLSFPPRTVSLNDIIAETAGGILGTVIWLIVGQRITGWIRRVTTPTGVAALAGRLLPGYIVLLLIALLMPFDFTISPAELAVKLHEDKVWFVPFTRPATYGVVSLALKTVINIMCFFPLGFLPAIAAHPPGTRLGRPRWGNLLGIGLAAAMLAEFLQLLVYSRIFDATDIVTGTLAVVLGWQVGQWALARWRSALSQSDPFGDLFTPSPLVRPSALLAVGLAWFAVVLYLNWTPFDFTTDPARLRAAGAATGPDEMSVWGLREMSWLPFVDYYWGSKYHALDQFLKKAISFLPLGVVCALAAARLFRPRATQAALGLALAAAVTIEVGRYFLPHHLPSVTDVLMQCAGTWIGFRVTQHVRAIFWAESALYGYLYQQVAPPHRVVGPASPRLYA